jgi:L-threonylcarbamoyladenylate synthase
VKTEILSAKTANGKDHRANIARAATMLAAGKLVAFPTDTVYGVAAVASRPDAVARLYAAKNRPRDKAIPILLADAEDLEIVASTVSDHVCELVARFWPGGLTLILPKSDIVPPEVSPRSSVAVRLPDLALTRHIISAAESPLAVTSANRSGQPSPCTATAVMAQLNGRISLVLDGGACPGGIPSTILDCTIDPPRILRPGAVSVKDLSRFTRIRW